MKLVAENFVPVSLNTDRLPDTDDGKFFRALMKQWPQGLWVVTPEGKVLGFHYHKAKPGETAAEGQRRWLVDTIAMLRDAVTAAGPLTVRKASSTPDPFSDRGRGLAEDGAARLAVSVIQLLNGKREGPVVIDSVHLDQDQWLALAPPKDGLKVDREWTIPTAASRQFAPALSPMTDSIFTPKPSDVTGAKLMGRVVRIGDGTAVVRYSGEWTSAHNRDNDPRFPIAATASGEGIGVYDTKSEKLTTVSMMFRGTYRNGGATVRPQQTVAVIDWTDGK